MQNPVLPKLPLTRTSVGFTLIELMVVVAIIATLAGFLLPNFNTFIRNQNIQQSQDLLVTDLRATQIKSLTGSSYALGVTYWGVKYVSTAGQNTRLGFFVTSSPAANLFTTCQNTAISGMTRGKSLSSGVVFRNSGCIFYSFENGNASSFTTDGSSGVIIGYDGTTGSVCYRTLVSETGLVATQEDVTCP